MDTQSFPTPEEFAAAVSATGKATSEMMAKTTTAGGAVIGGPVPVPPPANPSPSPATP